MKHGKLIKRFSQEIVQFNSVWTKGSLFKCHPTRIHVHCNQIRKWDLLSLEQLIFGMGNAKLRLGYKEAIGITSSVETVSVLWGWLQTVMFQKQQCFARNLRRHLRRVRIKKNCPGSRQRQRQPKAIQETVNFQYFCFLLVWWALVFYTDSRHVSDSLLFPVLSYGLLTHR